MRTGGDASDLLSLLENSHACLKTHGLYLGGSLVDLLGLLLCDTLDVEHLLLGTNNYQSHLNLPH